jgi:membrane protein YqaA with SNARE-associated domain
MFSFTEETGLVGLFVSAFVSATVLPGNSEVVLLAILYRHPAAFWTAIAVATLGNTMGGMTSFLIGRILPNRVEHKAIIYVHRYGYWALLFSWLPIVGDASCVAAGWLRFNPLASLALLATGKFTRYLALASGWVWVEGFFK